jgi:hypothetical protein
MSTLNVNALDKESGSTLTLGGAGTTLNVSNMVPDVALSNRNLIINGAMNVAQRGTSFTGIGGSAGTYSCDRWRHGFTATTARVTLSQDSNAPNGFAKSFKVAVTTAEASLNAASGCGISQPIEGQNLQQLAKGTADAKQVTVSFWVKTNKTGTYQFEFQDADNARNQVLSYTVNSADTWEYKTVTFDADTTGAFDNDNGASAYLQWFLFGGTNYTSGTVQSTWGSRSNANLMSPSMPNLADSTSNYWQITGVQLEVGSVATPFEHESFGQTMAKCQRYYEKSYKYSVAPATATDAGMMSSYYSGATGTNHAFTIYFKQNKRTAPTMSGWDGSGNASKCSYWTAGNSRVDNPSQSSYSFPRSGESSVMFNISDLNTSARQFGTHWAADAEL